MEREFTGECRACGETGHRRADCPSKPPSVCKLCKESGEHQISAFTRDIESLTKPGHIASECSANRMFAEFSSLGIQEMTAEEAWKLIEAADKEKDVDDIKKARHTIVSSRKHN